ncbi:MAG: DUF6079 family protein, partial [Candidatus Margulisiibacteriota bacterium]
PSILSLESILLEQFGYKGAVFNREVVFKELISRPTAIILDELSEFLRSKPSPASFYEDIRFLQFLGEFAFHHPLWVIASLQEWIEETGHVSSALFNRIKDRYPVRLSLSSTHVIDIIDQRLIRKKPEAIDVIRKTYDHFRHYFPQMPITFEDFRKTYPLHPITVRFLSGLTPLFSQHRGVIHFVLAETAKMLDQPVDALLTPEVIFDHFQDRILEIPEFARFIRIVQTYYAQQLPELFPKVQTREIAQAVLKILILAEISPTEKRKTAKEIANILLRRISTLGSDVNYAFIEEAVLEPLVAHQMYVQKSQEGEYFIDARSDEGLLIRRQIKEIRELYTDQAYLFRSLCCLTDLSYLPLNEIGEGKVYPFSWQNSKRECAVRICDVEPVDRETMGRIISVLDKRLDGYLLILSPFEENHRWIQSTKELHGAICTSALVFWEPLPMTQEDRDVAETYLARLQLQEKYPALSVELQKEKPAFREMMTRLFFEGRFFTLGTDRTAEMKALGYIPFDKRLAYLFDEPLKEKFPFHAQVMCRLESLMSHQIKSLFEQVIRPGKISKQEALSRGLSSLISGLLEPLGLIKMRAEGYTIQIDVEHPLVVYLDLIISQEQTLTVIRSALRHSKWGLDNFQVDCLLACAIMSGRLVAYQKNDPVPLSDILQLSSGALSSLQPGKTLPAELSHVISLGAFIWGNVSDTPTPLEQKKMWEEMVVFIRDYRQKISRIQLGIKRFEHYTLFSRVDVQRECISRWNNFLGAFVLSAPPTEGLEQTLRFMSTYPDFVSEKERLDRLDTLVTEHFSRLSQYEMYSEHPALHLSTLAEKESLELFKIDLNLFLACQSDISMSELTERWERFYFTYQGNYLTAHETFYDQPVFSLRSQLEGSETLQCLKRISSETPSITFDPDWWVLRSEL